MLWALVSLKRQYHHFVLVLAKRAQTQQNHKILIPLPSIIPWPTHNPALLSIAPGALFTFAHMRQVAGINEIPKNPVDF